LIVGSGGHAVVVADILTASGIEPLGYITRDPAPYAGRRPDLPVFGDEDVLGTVPHDAVVVAVGDNATRRDVFNRLADRGETIVSAIHPSAVIAGDAVIGPGCMISAGAIVNPGCVVGCNTILNTGCTVDHHCAVGDHVHIAPGVNLAGDVTVGHGSFVGIGSCVVQGVSIGEWAIVGAGAAVIRDVAPRTSVVGVPARQRT
jgi:sugar O-acyltransferase (sialic acid O-acetyltransferase NeuD family)